MPLCKNSSIKKEAGNQESKEFPVWSWLTSVKWPCLSVSWIRLKYILLGHLKSYFFFFRDFKVLRSDGWQLGAKQVWDDHIWEHSTSDSQRTPVQVSRISRVYFIVFGYHNIYSCCSCCAPNATLMLEAIGNQKS